MSDPTIAAWHREDELRAELRRLHGAREECERQYQAKCDEIGELLEIKHELLEALKLADAILWGANMNAVVVERKVKAAIAKAEGEQA